MTRQPSRDPLAPRRGARTKAEREIIAALDGSARRVLDELTTSIPPGWAADRAVELLAKADQAKTRLALSRFVRPVLAEALIQGHKVQEAWKALVALPRHPPMPSQPGAAPDRPRRSRRSKGLRGADGAETEE